MNVDRPGTRIRMPWESRSRLKVRSVTSGSLEDGNSTAPPPRRIPLISRCPKTLKNHLVAMLSEFVGTFMFLFFAFGGTNAVNTAPTAGEPLNANPAKLLYISLCFGMSLMVNAVCSCYSPLHSEAPSSPIKCANSLTSGCSSV